MPFDFENITIGQNITTYTAYNVHGMPDIFLEVEFRYPRTNPWNACIPIYEKYQGINFTESPLEDVTEWILECYDTLNPSNSSTWNTGENNYWTSHTRANKAKPVFDALNYENRYHLTEWLCRICTDTSTVNSQAGARIKALKERHGYHIATKKMPCPVCQEQTFHDLLLRLPRQATNITRRYNIPASTKRRVKELYQYRDVCFDERYPETSTTLVVDHKFPSTRWAAGETPNYPNATDDELRQKFQLLSNETNLQKERYCKRCFAEGIRGDFFGIKWYPVGTDQWNGANNSDENGCIGCPWYDMESWKQQFNEHLNNEGE